MNHPPPSPPNVLSNQNMNDFILILSNALRMFHTLCNIERGDGLKALTERVSQHDLHFIGRVYYRII